MSQHQAIDLVSRFIQITPSIASNLVRAEAVATRARGKEHINALVAALDARQREVLAELLQNERIASLFDALVQVQEQCFVGGWQILANGVPVALEPNGYTLAEEYIERMLGQSRE
jgi:hypothetical protein